jgi:hypothetical protein
MMTRDEDSDSVWRVIVMVLKSSSVKWVDEICCCCVYELQ